MEDILENKKENIIFHFNNKRIVKIDINMIYSIYCNMDDKSLIIHLYPDLSNGKYFYFEKKFIIKYKDEIIYDPSDNFMNGEQKIEKLHQKLIEIIK